MITYERSEFSSTPEIEKIFALIKQNHQVANHTKDVLFKNRHVKDFCEEARHFVLMDGKDPIYLHYDVSSWYHTSVGAAIRIERIEIYPSFQEYESARLKSLHSNPNSDGVNLN